MEDISINEKEVEKQEKVKASAEGQKPQQAPTEETGAPTTPEEKPKKKNKGLIATLVVLLILAIGGGVTAVILNNNKNNDSSNDQKNNEKETKEELPKVSQIRLTGNGLSDFDLEFLKLENKEENRIYSPLSIKYALAMLKDGAEGESKTQIENLIGDYNPKAYLNSDNRSLANALFIKDSYKENVLDSYIDTLDKKYNASVVYDPFVDATNINKWVSDKTLGIIDKLLDDGAVQGRQFALINALAIDMNWNYLMQCSTAKTSIPCNGAYEVRYAHENYLAHIGPINGNYKSLEESRKNGRTTDGYPLLAFDEEKEVKSVEIGASINNYDIVKEIGEEKIRNTVNEAYQEYLKDPINKSYEDLQEEKFSIDKYMEQLKSNYNTSRESTDFMIYDDDNVKAFAKDLREYDGSTLQYIGIMPKNEKLKDYVSSLKADNLESIIKELKTIDNKNFKEGVVTKISGYIPLFKYSADLKLDDDLRELGVTNVFSESDADLSNMISGPGYIDSATHKADIDFSNEGIKAAAATAMAGLGGAAGGFEYKWDVPIEEVDLTFDKPYMYLIRDKATGEVWFAGTVYEPTKAE